MSASFPSLGFELAFSPQRTLAVTFVGSSHLANAGIDIGDVLVSVNGESIAGAPLYVAKVVLDEIRSSQVSLGFQKRGTTAVKEVLIQKAYADSAFVSSYEAAQLPKGATLSSPTLSVSEADIRLVMNEANVSFDEARKALVQYGNDPVETVLLLKAAMPAVC